MKKTRPVTIVSVRVFPTRETTIVFSRFDPDAPDYPTHKAYENVSLRNITRLRRCLKLHHSKSTFFQVWPRDFLSDTYHAHNDRADHVTIMSVSFHFDKPEPNTKEV